jgi:hypothetical protein
MAHPTRFAKHVHVVAAWRRELKTLDDNRRLTGPAFLRAAMRNADIDQTRLDQLRATLEARRGLLPNLAAFIEMMTNELGRSKNYPGPPVKVSRVIGVWGNAQAEIEMREAGMSVLECVATAVAIAVERYPDHFGPVADPVAHEKKIVALKGDIGRGYERLREMYEPKDVEIVPPDPLRQSELAKAGYARIVFRDFPTVSPSTPNWPEVITETGVAVPVVISGPPPKESRVRVLAAIERTVAAS